MNFEVVRLEIAKLTPQPGDILVLKPGSYLPVENLKRLREGLELVANHGNFAIMLLTPGDELSLVKAATTAEAAAAPTAKWNHQPGDIRANLARVKEQMLKNTGYQPVDTWIPTIGKHYNVLYDDRSTECVKVVGLHAETPSRKGIVRVLSLKGEGEFSYEIGTFRKIAARTPVEDIQAVREAQQLAADTAARLARENHGAEQSHHESEWPKEWQRGGAYRVDRADWSRLSCPSPCCRIDQYEFDHWTPNVQRWVERHRACLGITVTVGTNGAGGCAGTSGGGAGITAIIEGAGGSAVANGWVRITELQPIPAFDESIKKCQDAILASMQIPANVFNSTAPTVVKKDMVVAEVAEPAKPVVQVMDPIDEQQEAKPIKFREFL